MMKTFRYKWNPQALIDYEARERREMNKIKGVL